LCSEIALHSDEDHTFTCILSSMNLSKWDEWSNTDAAYVATVFLDCVCSHFLHLASNIGGLERAIRSTMKGRALGLGALGFHTLLQTKGLPFGSLEAHFLNSEIFSHIKSQAQRATRDLAKALGEPEWCEGLGVRNTHLMAVAPNTSSALLCGGVSQGIEPLVSNVYSQATAA